MPEAHSSCGERNASAATTTMSAATNDVLAGAEVLDGDAGDPVSVELDAADQGEVTELEPLRRAGCPGSISGPSTTSAPAQRMEPSGCGSPGDRKGAHAVAVRQLRAELFLEERPDGLADGGVGERRALRRAAAASRPRCSPSHSSSAMNGIFSLKAGDGVAQVQCAPWPPTLVAAAAAGKRRGVGGALAAEVEQVGALAGGEHALGDRGCRDAERLAVGAGLRPLRHLARTRLFARVGDVADALAGNLRQLRAGFEHHHPGVRDLLEEHPRIGGADRPAADDGDGGVGHDVSFEIRPKGIRKLFGGRERVRRRGGPCGSRTAATIPTA